MQAIKIQKNFKGIVDSTLREGLQFKSANFTQEEKKKIFHLLCQIGVDYIELGNPMISGKTKHRDVVNFIKIYGN